MAMLSREDHSVPTPAPGAPEMFLGPSVRFEGKLTFKGTVRVDTAFKGTITTNDVLVVGERAVLEANVSCGSVVVAGTVTGNIEAKTLVELAPTARVKGDVETPALVVQKGATLTGGVTMKSGGDRNTAVRPATGTAAGAAALP
jgi:cytoskeletal protein CcmA (bactofilin family)